MTDLNKHLTRKCVRCVFCGLRIVCSMAGKLNVRAINASVNFKGEQGKCMQLKVDTLNIKKTYRCLTTEGINRIVILWEEVGPKR